MIEMTSDGQLPSQFAPFLFFLFLIYFLIGGKLLYDVVLVSAIQQCESAIITHISPPSWVSLPSPTPTGHHRVPGWAPCVTQQHQLSSVQFSHSVMSDSLRPHELQHARPPCPSPTPGVHSNSCPLSQWCHPAISSSVVPFSSCPQSLPASGSFSNESTLRMRWPRYWSFSFSTSPSSEHPGLIPFRMDWLDLLAVQGTLKSLLYHHSSKASVLRRSAFFTVQLSHPYMTTGNTIALTRQTFVGKVCLCFWICYLGWS